MPVYLIVLLILCIVLLVLLSYRLVKFGPGGFCQWLAVPVGLLADLLWQSQEGCKKAFFASLSLPRSHINQSNQQQEASYWIGYDLVSRLILLIPSVGVLLGDFVNNSLRSVALLHLQAVSLPVQIEAISGLLWFAAPALLGLILWDILGFTPGGSRLVPEVSTVKQAGLGIVIGGLFVLTLADVSFFYYYGQAIIDQVVRVHPNLELLGIPLSYLPLYLSLIFGLLMAVDSLIALLGLILGVCGLLSLCAGIIYCLFFVAHGLCSIAYTSLLTLSEKEPLPFKPYQVRVLIRTESAVDATQALPPLREKQDNAANALSPVTSSQLRSESDETESLSTNDTTKAVVPDPGLSRVPQPAPVPNAGEERLPEMGPQANITDIPNGLFHATTRNQLAEQIISNYAADHTIMDVVIGAVGLLFPGGGIAAMVASIAAQAPVIYLPMVKELAKVYSASPDRFTSGVVTKATIIGGLADVGSEVVQEYLATEFGQEFLLELLHEMLPELGIGALLALLPVAGGIISAGLDATIAATLTWRVGVTTVLYFLYGEEWLGSKKQTYDQAKALVGPLSPKMENRVRLDSILQQVPQIKEKAIRGLSQKIYFMKKANPSISKDAMLSTFQEEGIPNDLIEEALI